MRKLSNTARQMQTAAATFLAALSPEQFATAAYEFTDPQRMSWAYAPRPRPGVALLELGALARKAAHRLLSTALSRHTFAQAMAIMALEEVLDLDEGGLLRRDSDDYRIVVFGQPDREPWSWRFEGHHLSVTATIVGANVAVAPVFLGANPATITYAGTDLVRPLPLEEDLARALLTELSPKQRAEAIIAPTAPLDILSGTRWRVDATIQPAGIHHATLGTTSQEILARLFDVYVDRLTPNIADSLRQLLLADQSSFAWAGPATPGAGHYYRIQTPSLLIEYDNTQHGANHAHTVMLLPEEDFGASLLAAHIAAESP